MTNNEGVTHLRIYNETKADFDELKDELGETQDGLVRTLIEDFEAEEQ